MVRYLSLMGHHRNPLIGQKLNKALATPDSPFHNISHYFIRRAMLMPFMHPYMSINKYMYLMVRCPFLLKAELFTVVGWNILLLHIIERPRRRHYIKSIVLSVLISALRLVLQFVHKDISLIRPASWWETKMQCPMEPTAIPKVAGNSFYAYQCCVDP